MADRGSSSYGAAPSGGREEQNTSLPTSYAEAESSALELKLTSQSLLRAVPAASLVSSNGSIFGESFASSESFGLSRVCSALDIFVSHSWSAGRRSKYLALCFYFNSRIALGVGVFVFLAQAALASYGFRLAPVHFHTLAGTRATLCVFTYSGACGALLLALLKGHVLLPSLWRVRCFVDKCCIDQATPHIKAKGIRHIGAFLRHSSTLLVCWDDTYLSRLWCSFELAAYLRFHGVGRVDVVSLPQALFAVLHFCLSAVGFFLVFTIRSEEVQQRVAERTGVALNRTGPLVAIMVFVPVTFTTLVFAMSTAQSRLRLYHELRAYTLATRNCFAESDRRGIEGLVERLWGSYAAPGGSGIAAFEAYVRADLSHAINRMVGSVSSMPLPMLVFANAPQLMIQGQFLWGPDPDINMRMRCLTLLFTAFSPLMTLFVWNLGSFLASDMPKACYKCGEPISAGISRLVIILLFGTTASLVTSVLLILMISIAWTGSHAALLTCTVACWTLLFLACDTLRAVVYRGRKSTSEGPGQVDLELLLIEKERRLSELEKRLAELQSTVAAAK